MQDNIQHADKFYCPECKEFLPSGAFKLSGSYLRGRATYCKKCSHKRYGKSKGSRGLLEGQLRCSVCRQPKEKGQFFPNKKAGDGQGRVCRKCAKERILAHIPNAPNSKECKGCGKEKRIEEFYLHVDNRQGRLHTLNPLCRECAISETLARQPYSYLKGRQRLLRKLYNMTIGEYEYLYQLQNGVCAACGMPETTIMYGKVIPLSVDHDKKTDRNRALLCRECNMAFGLLHENPQRIDGLLRYAKEQADYVEGGDAI